MTSRFLLVVKAKPVGHYGIGGLRACEVIISKCNVVFHLLIRTILCAKKNYELCDIGP